MTTALAITGAAIFAGLLWIALAANADIVRELKAERERSQRYARLLHPSSRSYEIDLSAWGDQ